MSSSPALASGYLPGEPPLLVYVHGLGCAGSRDWPRVSCSPALRDRASLWVDLAGFGLSGRPPAFSYELADHARLVLELLDSYDTPIALVGHSMGGTVALILADQLIKAGRVPAALLLAEPNLRPEDATISEFVASMPVAKFVAEWAALRSAIESPWYRESVALSDPVSFHKSATSLVAHGKLDLVESFRALPIPRKGYLRGEKSGCAAWETAAQVEAAGIPVVTVEGSGHEFYYDAPEAFAASLAGLLAR